jgi:hypothetical protein
MHPKSMIEPANSAEPPPESTSAHYCGCALPIPFERAKRHGAAERVCARCGLPIAVRWRRW